jgi:hypothetical protein
MCIISLCGEMQGKKREKSGKKAGKKREKSGKKAGKKREKKREKAGKYFVTIGKFFPLFFSYFFYHESNKFCVT